MRTPPPKKKPRFTIPEFIEKAIEVHGPKYQYHLLDDAKLNTKQRFFCPNHGEFLQYGFHHLSGMGCKSCGIENRGSGAHYGKIELHCETHGFFVLNRARKHFNCPTCETERLSLVRGPKMDYYAKVKIVTEWHWNHNRGLIDPYFELKPRGKHTYHIDHIFTRIDGFNLDVDPEIVGHWCNLMLIPAVQNLRRGSRPLRSLEILLREYESALEIEHRMGIEKRFR